MVIKELKKEELTYKEIGELFDPPFNSELIGRINTGKNHRRKNEEYPIRKHWIRCLKPETVEEIKWLLRNSLFPYSQIAAHYNIDITEVGKINTGASYFSEDEIYPIRTFRGKKQSQPVEAILAKRSTDAIDTHLETGVCAE